MATENKVISKPLGKKKRHRGIEKIKERYGWICVSPWLVGLILFFIIPIGQSIFYSFCKVQLSTGKMITTFIGFDNYSYVLGTEPNYFDYLISSVGKFAYSFPIILILSLILALLLNQKFRGRIFFRALYFLPVIIASGVIIGTIMGETSVSSTQYTDDTISSEMFDVAQLIQWTGLPTKIGEYFQTAISSIMNLLWNCGVQIILFIAGLQSIPDLLYEVSKVEGATKWEEFWFITLPSLSRVIILVSVYTMVELMTSQTDQVISLAYTYMKSSYYGESSAMLWIYFLIIGTILAVALLIYNRVCVRRWE